jgi:hypothetical protein
MLLQALGHQIEREDERERGIGMRRKRVKRK